jgi:4-hydroxybenzoyl-CoA reductase subunit beta
MEVLPDFALLRPETIDDLIAARARHPNARLLAGGTDLIPNMRRGLIDTDTVIDLTACVELTRIEPDGDGLSVGAAVTLAALAENEAVRRDWRALTEAAGAVAGPTQRAMATVGGNICLDTRCIFYNQSEWWRRSNDYCLKYRGDICHVAPTSKRCLATYSGDLAAALLVYGATVEIAGPNGRRRIGLDELLVDDGMDYITLAGDEVLLSVHLPARFKGLAARYEKIRVRGAIDFPLAGVAVGLRRDTTDSVLRIGLTGTNSNPLLIEMSPDGEVEAMVRKSVSPARTGLIAPQYRRRAVAALAARMARDLAA